VPLALAVQASIVLVAQVPLALVAQALYHIRVFCSAGLSLHEGVLGLSRIA
jgi:hypothetical protein